MHRTAQGRLKREGLYHMTYFFAGFLAAGFFEAGAAFGLGLGFGFGFGLGLSSAALFSTCSLEKVNFWPV